MIQKPKSELSIIFISMTIMLVAFASIGYFYLTSNQGTLIKELETQRSETVNAILTNISETLQTHDNRLTELLHHLNISDPN